MWILGTTKAEANEENEPWFDTCDGTVTSKGVKIRILKIATAIALTVPLPFSLTLSWIRVHVVAHVLVHVQLYELPVHPVQVLLHFDCTGIGMGMDEITRVLLEVSQRQ